MVELHSDDGTHPRPLLRRGGWRSLDGERQFAIDEPGHYRDPEQVDFDGVIRNTAVTRLRQLKGLAVHDIAPVHLGRTLGAAVTHLSEDDVRIRDAVEGLEPTLRLVLIRTFFEGHTPAEIAVELGVTNTEVTYALAAAMSALSARSVMPRSDLSCREPEINCAKLAFHP